MALQTEPGAVCRPAEAWNGKARHQPAQQGTPDRGVPMCRVRPGALQLWREVRQRNGLAQFLGSRRACGGNDDRPEPRDGQDRSTLLALQRAPGARVRGRPTPDRPAVLPERRVPGVRTERISPNTPAKNT